MTEIAFSSSFKRAFRSRIAGRKPKRGFAHFRRISFPHCRVGKINGVMWGRFGNAFSMLLRGKSLSSQAANNLQVNVVTQRRCRYVDGDPGTGGTNLRLWGKDVDHDVMP